jgi:PAS domain S-box-containing protein
MSYQEKSTEELNGELTELQESCNRFKVLHQNAIAKHQLIEKELTETKTLNKTIVDSTSDLIFSVDSQNFGLLSFNKAFYNHFLNGTGLEVQPGFRPCDLYTSSKYISLWNDLFNKALQVGSYSEEYYYSCFGSRTLELNFNLLTHDKTVFGISIFAKDITERKYVEQCLCESNQKLQRIFDNLQDAFFETDKDGKFTTVSPSALPIFRYETIDEMLCMPTINLYANLDERDKMLAILSEKGKIVDYIGLARRKDGTTFWSSLNVQIIYDESGEFAGTMGVVRDITDRKNHEIELNKKLTELQWHFDVAIGRELKMIELKEEINDLLLKAGEKAKYKIYK